MIRTLALFVVGCIAFGAILFVFAWWAGAGHLWVNIVVAGLLCGVPGVVSLVIAELLADFRRETALLVVFGGMALRMPVALGLGWVLVAHIPKFTEDGDLAFWGWLIAYYLFTLTWEVAIVVGRELHRPSMNSDRG